MIPATGSMACGIRLSRRQPSRGVFPSCNVGFCGTAFAVLVGTFSLSDLMYLRCEALKVDEEEPLPLQGVPDKVQCNMLFLS